MKSSFSSTDMTADFSSADGGAATFYGQKRNGKIPFVSDEKILLLDSKKTAYSELKQKIKQAAKDLDVYQVNLIQKLDDEINLIGQSFDSLNTKYIQDVKSSGKNGLTKEKQGEYSRSFNNIVTKAIIQYDTAISKLEGVLPSKKDSASKPEDSIKKNGPNYLLIGVGVAAAAIIGYFIFKK
mgnify:CR=1